MRMPQTGCARVRIEISNWSATLAERGAQVEEWAAAPPGGPGQGPSVCIEQRVERNDEQSCHAVVEKQECLPLLQGES